MRACVSAGRDVDRHGHLDRQRHVVEGSQSTPVALCDGG